MARMSGGGGRQQQQMERQHGFRRAWPRAVEICIIAGSNKCTAALWRWCLHNPANRLQQCHRQPHANCLQQCNRKPPRIETARVLTLITFQGDKKSHQAVKLRATLIALQYVCCAQTTATRCHFMPAPCTNQTGSWSGLVLMSCKNCCSGSSSSRSYCMTCQLSSTVGSKAGSASTCCCGHHTLISTWSLCHLQAAIRVCSNVVATQLPHQVKHRRLHFIVPCQPPMLYTANSTLGNQKYPRNSAARHCPAPVPLLQLPKHAGHAQPHSGPGECSICTFCLPSPHLQCCAASLRGTSGPLFANTHG